MANINNVLLEFANRLLDVKNGKENPTLGELIDTPKAQLIEYFMGIVGEMEQRETFDYSLSSWTSDDMKAFGRNELRIEIRAKLKESVE